MHYADAVGLEKVLETIDTFREQFGPKNWTPAPLLERLVKKGKSFSDV